MDQEQKAKAACCVCGYAVQDVKHAIFDCEHSSHLARYWAESAEEALAVQARGGRSGTGRWEAFAAMEVKEKITEMLHMAYDEPMSTEKMMVAREYGAAAKEYLREISTLLKTMSTKQGEQ